MTMEGVVHESETVILVKRTMRNSIDHDNIGSSDAKVLGTLAMYRLMDVGFRWLAGIDVTGGHYPGVDDAIVGIDNLLLRLPDSIGLVDSLREVGGDQHGEYTLFKENLHRVFHSRVRFWQAEIGADLTLKAATADGRYNLDLIQQLGQLRRGSENYDAAIYAHHHLIQAVNCDNLPEVYRSFIAPGRREIMPWWLAGDLEFDYQPGVITCPKFQASTSQDTARAGA